MGRIKQNYRFKYYALDSNGRITIESNDFAEVMSQAAWNNWEVRERRKTLKKLKIPDKVWRPIVPKQSQIELFEDNEYGKS